MNDERIIEASENAVKVIVRRPHAYKFKQQYRAAPIPGLVVLDGDGKFVGGVKLPSKNAVDAVVKLLAGTN